MTFSQVCHTLTAMLQAVHMQLTWTCSYLTDLYTKVSFLLLRRELSPPLWLPRLVYRLQTLYRPVLLTIYIKCFNDVYTYLHVCYIWHVSFLGTYFRHPTLLYDNRNPVCTRQWSNGEFHKITVPQDSSNQSKSCQGCHGFKVNWHECISFFINTFLERSRTDSGQRITWYFSAPTPNQLHSQVLESCLLFKSTVTDCLVCITRLKQILSLTQL